MTPVDALDTLILSGLTGQADQTRELIAKNLSFDQDIYVKNFEIAIRMLGGLLQLPTHGRQAFAGARRGLGQASAPAFNSPTGLPTYVNLKTGAVRGRDESCRGWNIAA
jgi:hypothetical protein